jgi:hypothetical protein
MYQNQTNTVFFTVEKNTQCCYAVTPNTAMVKTRINWHLFTKELNVFYGTERDHDTDVLKIRSNIKDNLSKIFVNTLYLTQTNVVDRKAASFERGLLLNENEDRAVQERVEDIRVVPVVLDQNTPVYAFNMTTSWSLKLKPSSDKDIGLGLDAGGGRVLFVKTEDGLEHVIMGRNFRGNWNCWLGGKVEDKKKDAYEATGIREAEEELFFSLPQAIPQIIRELGSSGIASEVIEEITQSLLSLLAKKLPCFKTSPADWVREYENYVNVSWIPAKGVHHKFSRSTVCCSDPVVYTDKELADSVNSLNTFAQFFNQLKSTLELNLKPILDRRIEQDLTAGMSKEDADKVKRKHSIRSHALIRAISPFTEFGQFAVFSIAELNTSFQEWSKSSLAQTLQADAKIAVSVGDELQMQNFQRLDVVVLRAFFEAKGLLEPVNAETRFDICDSYDSNQDDVRLPENNYWALKPASPRGVSRHIFMPAPAASLPAPVVPDASSRLGSPI